MCLWAERRRPRLVSCSSWALPQCITSQQPPHSHSQGNYHYATRCQCTDIGTTRAQRPTQTRAPLRHRHLHRQGYLLDTETHTDMDTSWAQTRAQRPTQTRAPLGHRDPYRHGDLSGTETHTDTGTIDTCIYATCRGEEFNRSQWVS